MVSWKQEYGLSNYTVMFENNLDHFFNFSEPAYAYQYSIYIRTENETVRKGAILMRVFRIYNINIDLSRNTGMA